MAPRCAKVFWEWKGKFTMGKNKLAELMKKAYYQGFADGQLCGQQQ